MSRTRLDWDGGRRLGPVWLGMSQQAIAEAIPGKLSTPDPIDSADPESPSWYWDSEPLGLSILIDDQKAVYISANDEFRIEGVNLIGMSADAAILLAGGELSRETLGPVSFVRTGSGLELYVEEGRILVVVLDDDGD
jgi:hypothetical protein